MAGICAQLAARTERLARAQRAFWDAWKALGAGDRGRLKEAYTAKRALEAARQDIIRITYASWAPRVRTHVTLPEAYHLVTFEEEQYVDELGDYFTHFRESTHEHGSGVTAVRWMPDGSLLSAGLDRTIKISHPDKPKEGVVTLDTGMYAPMHVLLLPDNRIAMSDDNSTLAVWTKNAKGEYEREDIIHLQGHSISEFLYLPDDTWFIAADPYLLVGRAEGDGHRVWSKLEGHRGTVYIIHPLSDGRIISGWGDGEVIVWKREGDSYVIDSRLSSPKGYRNGVHTIHANADGRIIVTDFALECEVWQTMEDGMIVYQGAIGKADDLSDGMVLPDGSIALLHFGEIDVYAQGNWENSRVLFRIHGDEFDIREDGYIAVADDNNVKVITGGERPDFEVEDEWV